jgi:uncharacterized membrane protein
VVKETIIAVLWSLSPFGEAKVGIPFGMLNGANIYLVFVLCVIANILVFPMMMFFLDYVNTHFLKWRFYKKSAIWVAKRAKKGTGSKIEKYGFWGLLLFVMIPVPGTGVYAGSIATYLFNIPKKKAFMANSIGITLSSIIIWTATYLSMQ